MYTLINEQAIYQYFGDDDPEMTRMMIQIILDTNITDLKELETFYASADYVTIKKRCHKAKPSMSYIGALSSKTLLEQIENDLENSKSLNSELQKDLETIEIELKEFLKNL